MTKKPYQKWHEDCIVFLDDCFASDSAVATLAPYFGIRDFRVIFPGEIKGKQNGVKDTPVVLPSKLDSQGLGI